MNEQHQPVCFAVMPFTVREADLPRYQNDPSHWREVYQGLIVPAIRQADLRAQRDDEDYSTRLVGEGIWSKIEQADMVLCDLSSHNPNVHLELGWAMRADKKIVLIKDEVTSFNFDLNQYYTYQYTSTLQPTVLQKSIEELSTVIRTTMADSVANYSMVSKLALRKRAVDAASSGSVEVELLQELLGQVQRLKRQEPEQTHPNQFPPISLDVKYVSSLPDKIVGSTWRKENGLEEIFFTSREHFAYSSVGMLKWHTNDVSFNIDSGTMQLTWRQDGFRSYCRFDAFFSQFIEQNGECWCLVAKEPYLHSSFGSK